MAGYRYIVGVCFKNTWERILHCPFYGTKASSRAIWNTVKLGSIYGMSHGGDYGLFHAWLAEKFSTAPRIVPHGLNRMDEESRRKARLQRGFYGKNANE